MNDLMTIEMVMKEFGYGKNTLAIARMKKELFPYYKVGNKIMYKRSEIVSIFEKGRVGVGENK